MSFCKSDKRFKHSYCLSIFWQGCSTTQIREVSLKDHFGFLCAHRVYISLDKNNIFGELINRPFYSYLIIFLFVSWKSEFKVCLSQVVVSVLLVNHNKNQIKSRQKRRSNTSVLVWIISVVPLLSLAWVSSGQDCTTRVDLAADTSLCDTDSLLFHCFLRVHFLCLLV